MFWVIAAVVVVGGVAGLVAWARIDQARRAAASATVSLVVDATGVRRTLADGRSEEVRWDELIEVVAHTLPRGAWGERTRFVLDGGGLRGCIVPRAAAESGGLLGALGGLPGFDHRALADVLERSRPGRVVLWRRSAT